MPSSRTSPLSPPVAAAAAPPPFAATRRSHTRHSLPAATMPEYRHVRSGSLNIPSGSAAGSPMMPRSPPSASLHAPGHVPVLPAAAAQARPHLVPARHRWSLRMTTKNRMRPKTESSADRHPAVDTSHVPCKFFRQGTCQAGSACPFSHDLGASAETVCKYFAKSLTLRPRLQGNCKFGPKCANIHVLPDGRRINYGKNGVTIGTSPINLSGRPSPSPASPTAASASAFHSSASALTSSLYRAEPGFPGDERHHHLDNGIPAIDMPFSHSTYGSPRDDDPSRLGFGLSPANGKGLSVLDAPLPASFDSNGISNAARFPTAPWPSSVPSKFGLESPTPSLSNAKESRTSETLKLLHTSAFGSSEHLITPTASSPPNSQPVNGDEYFGKRAMHSSRYAKPRMLSSSLPKTTSVDRDWEAEFAFGDDDNGPENYLPENLQDLLTPAEKARRGSMRADGDPVIECLSKYGSPIGSSPSRWGSLFQRQKEEEDATRVARGAASAFGHVGSPLRKSTLAQEMGDGPNGAARPSASRSGSESMSVLSQQLQRSRLDDSIGGNSPLLHPTTARISSSGIGAIGKDRAMERHVSSGSISSSMTGRFTTPIDEEDPAFVFSMEEEEDSGSARVRKRASAGLSMGGFPSYAGAVSGKGGNNGSKEARDAVSVNGR
ncbi:Protein cps3 [Tolypocladium paradoxum]|uniref:Protein cps3 n=1 Tax=Tolypocladium paradoxum TaxID=94208 RepID=A0A2S4KNC6_9HYPO|nr:Protein cps3 [Tolypocladium paradoxum]